MLDYILALESLSLETMLRVAHLRQEACAAAVAAVRAPQGSDTTPAGGGRRGSEAPARAAR
jgi:hypothetical protein